MSPPLLDKVLNATTDHERVTALAQLGNYYWASRNPDVLIGLCTFVRDKNIHPELRLGAYLMALQIAGVSACEWPHPPYEFDEIDKLFDQGFLARWDL
jgi:hypothetical protein